MAYSRANSTNELRTSIFELLEAVEVFQQVAQQDADRLKKMGASFAKQDTSLGKQVNQLEVR